MSEKTKEELETAVGKRMELPEGSLDIDESEEEAV